MRILVCMGTRPEVIKMAPLVTHLRKHENVKVVVCSTGQHRQMLDSALDVFELTADVELDVMKPQQDLSMVTCAILERAKPILRLVRPDMVLVQGDTSTAFAMALAAFYEKIPVGHVEAGLRTFDRLNPYPEETNRCLISKVADLHFTPTDRATDHLVQEGISLSSIHQTGNTVVDALLTIATKIENNENLKSQIENRFKMLRPDTPMVLITGHRRENFGEGLRNVCRAVYDLAVKYPNIDFLYPMHLNPQVQEPVKKILKGLPNIFLHPPVDYLSMVYLLKRCHLVLTDSGGLQEEAPSFGRPVLVTRERTERPEGIDAGTAMLVGTNYRKIVEQVSLLLDDKSAYLKMSQAHNPFGDGDASIRIADALITWLSKSGHIQTCSEVA